MNKFATIIQLCERQGFISKIFYPRLKQNVFNIEPTGALLVENLRSEWYNNVVVNKDISVFMNSNVLSSTFDYAKAACEGMAPFGVAEIDENGKPKITIDERIQMSKYDEKVMDFSFFFEKGAMLKFWMFVVPSEANKFFHQWQGQRRRWWRKWPYIEHQMRQLSLQKSSDWMDERKLQHLMLNFSASPGRYSLTDIKTSEKGNQTVEIVAKYPWGTQVVENLALKTTCRTITASQLQMKDGRKQVTAQCITSEVCLSTMFLNTLCDAYDDPVFHGTARPLLRLHRKLAPYKISVAIASSPNVDELKDLGLYICRQLRTNNVSSLFLPISFKHTLDSQWKQYDQMGIPYNILLNENTLKNGLVNLRSRDTTLKEQVDVMKLVPYVEQLCKNY